MNEHYCDVVMKGGVTSGIVYPPAIAEIAKTFTFKNVGGTSAGAIAAAMTAAAQLGALRGAGGFEILERLPGELAAHDLLFRLFRPNRSTRALYRTITALAGRPSIGAKIGSIFTAHPVASLAGAAPSIALLLDSSRHWYDYLLAAPLAIGGALCASLAVFAYDFFGALKTNGYGLVSGITDDGSNAPALTSWLEAKLRDAAGITDETPLTFGMLWDHTVRDACGLAERPDDVDVNLEMVTTCLTLGKPLKFPLDTTRFFFSEPELLRYFPPSVVTWMKEKSRGPNNERERRRFPEYAKNRMYALPPIGDLPVIVATRMSLSFPILFSAVPLRCADFTAEENQETREKPVTPNLEPCWFTDGGLSSNFPVSLFDAPLPRWPTFAINLAGFANASDESPDEGKNVWMPRNNGDGLRQPFKRFKDVGGFLVTIFDTMQNWADTTQSMLPGYRDRIVTVRLTESEGGLNLDMPKEVIDRLRTRGAAAGALIAEKFADAAGGTPKDSMNWSNHRWLRLRTLLGALHVYLEEYDGGYAALVDGLPAFIDERLLTSVYQSAALTEPNIMALLRELHDLGVDFEQTPGLLLKLPKPPPDLVLRPDLSSVT